MRPALAQLSRIRWVRLVLLAASIYAAVLALLAFFQRSLLYQPTRASLADSLHLTAGTGAQPWKNPAGEIIGWHWPAVGKSAGRVLIFHGNAGCASQRDYLADPIRQAGPADVYVVEYPGYGARSGSPNQTSILKAAEEAYDILASQGPVFLVSESLGAGPAAHLVRLHGGAIPGILLLVPYTNLPAVAQRTFPFVPASWVILDRYAPDQWLAGYRGAAGFVVAAQDEVIPSDLGRGLFERFDGPRKKLWWNETGHHNDVSSQTPAWWRDVFAFWRGN